MQIKMFEGNNLKDIEKDMNKFLNDKDIKVFSISQSEDEFNYTFCVLYEFI